MIKVFIYTFALVDAKKVERIAKALGDPYRLKIIEAVKKGGGWMQCVSIIDMLSIAQSTISHHIKQLVDADLLIAEKDGRNMKYTINKATFDEYTKFLGLFAV